jgi:hypothetical protein
MLSSKTILKPKAQKSKSKTPVGRRTASVTRQPTSIVKKPAERMSVKAMPKSDISKIYIQPMLNVYKSVAGVNVGSSQNASMQVKPAFISYQDLMAEYESSAKINDISAVKAFTPRTDMSASKDPRKSIKKESGQADVGSRRQFYTKMFKRAVIDRTGRPSYRDISKSPKKDAAKKIESISKKLKIDLKDRDTISVETKGAKERKSVGFNMNMDSDFLNEDIRKLEKERKSQRVGGAGRDSIAALREEMAMEMFYPKQISSKESQSSFAQEIAARTLIRAKSINQTDMLGTVPYYQLRRTGTMDITSKLEDEVKLAEKPGKSKSQLRKIHSSDYVRAHSTHALILGRYGKAPR